MTLIAATIAGETPVLISDFLSSTPSHGDNHEAVPTYVNVNSTLPPEWGIKTGTLYRKSAIINKHFTVGGAGSLIVISSFMKLLFEKFHEAAPTQGQLIEFFKEHDDLPTLQSSCAIIGWFIENNKPVSFRYVSNESPNLEFGGSYIEGSGAKLFKEKVWSKKSEEWGALPFSHAQKYCFERIAVLIANEMSNGISISNFFGGGYDLILYDGKEFTTQGDVSYLILTIEMLDYISGKKLAFLSANGNFYKPESPELGANPKSPVLLKIGYAEEFPVIRSVIPRNNFLNVGSLESEGVFVVEPLATKGGKGQKLSRTYHTDEFPYFGEYLMVAVWGVMPTGEKSVFIASVRGNEARSFHLEPSDKAGKVKFYFPSAITNNILLKAKAYFNPEQ